MSLTPIRAGMKLDGLKGLTGPKKANVLQSVANAVLNARITEGDSNKITINENGLWIQIKRQDSTSGGGPPFITGTQPLATDGGVGWILADDENNNEVTFGGQFSAMKYAYIFNGSVFGQEWIKRTSIAKVLYNMYPAPVAWFLYNSNWVDPQPFG